MNPCLCCSKNLSIVRFVFRSSYPYLLVFRFKLFWNFSCWKFNAYLWDNYCWDNYCLIMCNLIIGLRNFEDVFFIIEIICNLSRLLRLKRLRNLFFLSAVSCLLLVHWSRNSVQHFWLLGKSNQLKNNWMAVDIIINPSYAMHHNCVFCNGAVLIMWKVTNFTTLKVLDLRWGGGFPHQGL